MIQQAIHDVAERKNLDFDTAEQVMGEIVNGETTRAQIASFLMGLQMRGEGIGEITACAAMIREKALKSTPSFDVIDIVGAGGDKVGTFNVSTTSAFVVATGDVLVAKHGNRSVSSKSGAVDVLEQLGVNLVLTAEQSEELLEEMGMCFMSAQAYHSSMKYVALVRKELATRTISNILGPLSNPAGVIIQLLGVYNRSLVEPLTEVLSNLGITRGLVVYDTDGLDEATVTGFIHMCETRFGELEAYDITPEEVGLPRCELSDIIGGIPEENAQVTRDALLEELKEAKRDIVILSSAMSLYLGTDDYTIKDYVRRAAELIDSGIAYVKLNEFVNVTETCQTLQTIRGEDMILDAITDIARLWVLETEKRCPLKEMKEKTLALPKREFSFERATNCSDMTFICGVKGAFPSEGVIAPNFSYTEIARGYEVVGASTISMLTEPGYPVDRNQYLTEIKSTVQIPLLRRDFTVDEYQIYGAKVAGVGATLLVRSLLDTETLSFYINVCGRLGLSILTEAHTKKGVLSACEAGTRVIGIDNRSLKTSEVNFNSSIQLRPLVPLGILLVTENGIRTTTDIHVLCEVDANVVLIGETLMHSVNEELRPNKSRSGCYLM